jgi:hypothetical protein
MRQRDPICSGCGRPASEHVDAVMVQLDLVEVIARWLLGYGTAAGEPMPSDTSIDELAEALRRRFVGEDGDDNRERLMLAARLTAEYIGEQVIAQYELRKVAGHA